MILRHFISRLIIVLTLALPSTVSANTTYLSPPDSHIAALTDLYHATSGPNWSSNVHWFTGAGVCTWVGVNCFDRLLSDPEADDKIYQQEIVELKLRSRNLAGVLPASLAQLTLLTTLDLSHNHLTGQLPTSIGNLAKLSQLDLSHNRIEGELPTTIGNLAKLSRLDLSYNQFTGSIPTTLTQLAALTSLNLGYNQIIGTIPISIGQLVQLKWLALTSNQLSGEIPVSISQLSHLEAFSGQGNHFTGGIAALTGCTALTYINLRHNQLTEPLPETLGNLTQLSHLILDHNQLSGPIPDAITTLTALTELVLHYNQLTHYIPADIGQLTNLTVLSLTANQLTGEIPASIGALTALEELALSANQLSGSIPESMGQLTKINHWKMTDNQLSGRVPDSVFALVDKNKPLYFHLERNYHLGGALPRNFDTKYPWLTDRMIEFPHAINNFGMMSCYDSDSTLVKRFADNDWVSFSCPSDNRSCPENNTGPQCMAGNPINVRTGIKQQVAVDFAASGQSPLRLTRRYDSERRKWSFNLLPQPLVIDLLDVLVRRSNGKNYLFRCDSNPCRHTTRYGESGGYQGYQLRQFTDHYTFTLPSGTQHIYNTSGVMTSTINPQGGILNYTEQANTLMVSDTFNQQFVLTLSDGRVTQAETLAGIFSYTYNSDDFLTVVTRPDTTTVHYHYDEESFSTAGIGKGLLTGKTDSKGQRVASWYYDDEQRAYKSDHGAGIDSTEIRFISEWDQWVVDEANNPIAQQRVRDVINPLGQRTRTTFVAPINQRAEKIETFDSTDTLITSEHYHYNDEGYLAESTDKYGINTQFTRDDKGRELTRIDYAGTPNARTTNTTYAGDSQQPARITTPERVIDIGYLSYNGSQLISKQTVTDRATNAVRMTTYTYNSAGLLATIDGPRTDVNDITRFEYNAQGLRTKTTNALGHSTTITAFNATGQPTTITDANGDTITLTYDVMGRLLSSQQAEQIKHFAYDANGLLTQSTLANGSTIDYEYDTASRLIAMVDSLGNRLDYQLDAAGNRLQTQTKDNNGSLQQTQQQLFDEFSRLSTVTNGTGDSVNLTYAANGNLTDTTDALSNKTRNSYDTLGRLAAIHDPNNGQTQYGYDAAGRTDSITDASGLKTSYRYNGFGEKTQQISPDTGETLYGYDNAGNLTSETDARGITVSYDYDALNRLIATRYPDSSENITFTYDSVTNGNKGIGRLTGIIDPSGSRQLRYGSLGQLLQETYTIGGQNYTLAYQYDSAGQLTGMTYPSGRQVDLTLNTLGQIEAMSTTASVENATTQSVMSHAAYLPFGPTRQFTQGNGLLNTLNYDRNYQLISQTLTGLKNQQLIYSATGNITAINQPSGGNQTFTYDKLSRLTSATGDYGSLAYSYDAIGNRLSKTDNVSSSAEKVANYHYREGSHHLGKITIGDVEQMNSLFSQFNQARRMASVTNRQMKTNYLYDSRGLRVSKTAPDSQIHYHYEPGGLLIGESDEKGVWQKEYLYFNAQLIAMIDYSSVTSGGAGQIYYAHNDHLGTPKLLTNSAGKPVWQASYTPFGLATINADVDNNGVAVTLNIRFPGQYYDAESGLHYNWFRYYDPAIGRYVTSDPIGLAGGMNTYGYVGGNPVNYTDPQGLTSLRFNRGSGVLIIDPEVEGRIPYNVPATSGDPNCSCDETVKNQGPIPVANYYLNVSDLTDPDPIKDIRRRFTGDWGDWRVPLKPTQPELLHGRSGFFLHGGSTPGSAGCVDIGGGLFGDAVTDKVLEDILNDPDGKIQFRVRSN